MKHQQKPRIRKKTIKYNNGQRQRHIANNAVKGLACVYVYAGKNTRTRLFDLSTMTEVRVTPLIDSAMKWYPHAWVVRIALLIREKNGKIKAPGETVAAYDHRGKPASVMFETLQPTLDQWHKDLVRNNPTPECLVNVGWVATPDGSEISPETEMALYELVNGFSDYIAPWEVEQKRAAGYDVAVMD